MTDGQESGTPGTLSPTLEERIAMREVSHDEEQARLDRARHAARTDAQKILDQVADAVEAIRKGRREVDDHLLISGLRKLLAVGLLAKPVADRLESELPQPERLPGL